MEAFSRSVDSGLFKLWSPGVGWGHNGGGGGRVGVGEFLHRSKYRKNISPKN